MTEMPSKDMIPVFASTELKLHPQNFVIVSLPVKEKENVLEAFSQLTAFNSITIDYEEISLILKESDWKTMIDRFPKSLCEGPYKVITFDIVLDLSLVGFLSVVSSILADEGISIYAVSTYLRDHILVKSKDAEKAIFRLEELIYKCKSTKL